MPKIFDIFNYNSDDVKYKTYDEIINLNIKKQSLIQDQKRVKIRKQATISFSNIRFNNLVSIDVDEGIEEKILINFHNCYIDSFNDFGLISKKVDLSFNSSIVKHLRIDSGNLNLIKLNNCFGFFFIEKVEKVNISFTENNIFIDDLKDFKKNNNISLNEFLSAETEFHLTDIVNIVFYGSEVKKEKKDEFVKENKLRFYRKYVNIYHRKKLISKRRFLTSEEKEKIDVNLNLNYNQGLQDNKTRISNFNINTLSLKGKNDGEINIEDCKINEIYIFDFSPQSDFTLYNIKPFKKTGKFEIQNSNLDNTWFKSIILKDYLLVFNNSSFVNTKFLSTVSPSLKKLKKSILSIENIHHSDKQKDDNEFYRNMYELFLELNQAFEKRGNFYEAQKMKSTAYYFLNKAESCNVLKSDFYNNKIILLLNQISNYHGISLRNAIFSWFYHKFNGIYYFVFKNLICLRDNFLIYYWI